MATAVTTDDTIIIDRDYKDNFSIKNDIMNTLVPKYFPEVELAELNVGLLGLTTEYLANSTEDAFNTASIYINEAFPQRAIIPESIYSHAAIFQLSNVFTPCAKCQFVFLLTQSEILEKGVADSAERKHIVFMLDRNTTFYVEDIPFTFDYDIRIDATLRKVGARTEYNFSAKYVLDATNDISEVNDPYLKIRKTSEGFLLLALVAHQVERTIINDTIISNTKVNYPVLTYEFENGLAGFDIFYKAPTDSNYTQLTKLVKFSNPVKIPFCYYKLRDENLLEITFSSRDGYFKPDFNSDIRIVLYTTLGTDGNFDFYNGSNIEISLSTERFEYNQGITIAAKTTSASQGGAEKLSLEGLQALTVEGFRTANELATENDIKEYYYNYKYRYGSEIFTMKRRDDIVERTMSAFLLIKNGDYIYPTNTCFINVKDSEYDSSEENNRYTLKAGHLWVYDEDAGQNTLKMLPGKWAYNPEDVEEAEANYDFVYANPFMLSMTKSPTSIGLYQNIVNEHEELEFISANDDTYAQFIATSIALYRTLESNSEYIIDVPIFPSSTLENYVTNLNTYEGNNTRLIIAFTGASGEEIGYAEMLPVEINPNDNTNTTFRAIVSTNDFITSRSTIELFGVESTTPSIPHPYIPITGERVNIYILYRDDDVHGSNKFGDYFDDISDYRLVNVYSCRENPLTFVNAMNMMRCTAKFTQDENEEIITNISLLPVMRASLVQDTDSFADLITRISNNYNYLEASRPYLRGLTTLDVKLYNTYGKSLNYYIGDDYELIDKVNMEISFQVTPLADVDDITLKSDLTKYIKSFIENINSDGNNSLYISNLIRAIENNFPTIHHLKFLGINDYSTDYQTITSRVTDMSTLSKEDRMVYVPEVLVVNDDCVHLLIMDGAQ